LVKTFKRAKFPAYNNDDYKDKITFKCVKQYRGNDNSIISGYGDVDLVVLEYTLSLQSFLNQMIEFGADVWHLNCILNFTYNPILSFERGRNQKDLFIYQAYLSFYEDIYNTHILSLQRYRMDINEKFIFE